MLPSTRKLPRLFAAALLGYCCVTNATCLSRKFADDLATGVASDLANILIDRLVIDPLDDALADEGK